MAEHLLRNASTTLGYEFALLLSIEHVSSVIPFLTLTSITERIMDTRVYVISRRLKIVKFKGDLETSETCSSRTIGYSSRIFKNCLCFSKHRDTGGNEIGKKLEGKRYRARFEILKFKVTRVTVARLINSWLSSCRDGDSSINARFIRSRTEWEKKIARLLLTLLGG